MMFLLVGIGGALGSISCFVIGKEVGTRSKATIPIGTMIVNISGAFLLGIVSGVDLVDNLYLFLSEGFLGGFTPFSTFMYEGFYLVREREKLNIIIYIAGTVLLGLIGFATGYFLINLI